jgi:hypothetical protein
MRTNLTWKLCTDSRKSRLLLVRAGKISPPICQCCDFLNFFWPMLGQYQLFLVNAGTISPFWSMRSHSKLLLVNAWTVSRPIGQCWDNLNSFWSILGQFYLLLVNAGSFSTPFGQCWNNLNFFLVYVGTI